jgi:Uma2 family endonuclease
MSPEEYLALERKAETRSEYLGGELFAMSGADHRHDTIAVNVLTELNLQFKGRRCSVHSSDMRVKVKATGLYTYPDVSALCGEARYEDEHLDTLLNPTLIVEVLSPSTEAYDRGGKFAHYRGVGSLTDYVMIAQDRVSVEHYARQADGRWSLTVKSGIDEVLELPVVGARLALKDVYDKVDLMPGPPVPPRAGGPSS